MSEKPESREAMAKCICGYQSSGPRDFEKHVKQCAYGRKFGAAPESRELCPECELSLVNGYCAMCGAGAPMTAEQFHKNWRKRGMRICDGQRDFFREMEAYAAERLSQVERERDEARTVEDGFGSVWPPCEKHNRTMQVMRPGDARCVDCESEEYISRLIRERDEAHSLLDHYADTERKLRLRVEQLEQGLGRIENYIRQASNRPALIVDEVRRLVGKEGDAK